MRSVCPMCAPCVLLLYVRVLRAYVRGATTPMARKGLRLMLSLRVVVNATNRSRGGYVSNSQ